MMNNYRMNFFRAILFGFFLLSTNATAQQLVNIVEKFDLQKDIEALDDYIDQRIQKDTFMTKFGSLRKVHIFEMERSDRKKILTKNEWFNGSFLNYLKPCYVKSPEKINGKKQRYLYAHTFLVDSMGISVAVYVTGDTNFYMDGRTFPQELCSEQNTFVFWGGWDFQLKNVAKSYYMIIRDNELYCFDEMAETQGLIPWGKYIEVMKQRYIRYRLDISDILYE